MILDRFQRPHNLQELKLIVFVVVVFVQLDLDRPFPLFHVQDVSYNLFYSTADHCYSIQLANNTHSSADEGRTVVIER